MNEIKDSKLTISHGSVSYILTEVEVFNACRRMLSYKNKLDFIGDGEVLSSFHDFLINKLDAKHYRLEITFRSADGDGQDDWPSNVEVDLKLYSYKDTIGKVDLLEEDTSWGIASLENVLERIALKLADDNN